MEDLKKSFRDLVHSPHRHRSSRSRNSHGASPPDGCSSEASNSCPETDKLLEDFHIPTYMLSEEEGDNEADDGKDFGRPSHPVVVFINSKSGGQLGGELLVTYRKLLRNSQVFDLGTEAPDKVLQKLFTRLEMLSRNGDSLAKEVKNNLRLIVAGGDGTAGWLLGVVCDLKLSPPPPIATVPLGTGNNLPFAFGWGKKNPGTDRQSVVNFLKLVKEAKMMNIDNWHIIMRMETPDVGRCDPIPPLDLPHSLHKFQRVSSLDSLNKEGHQTYRGGFWNYFSLGMDAQVSYEFHTERKKHPEKFRNQLLNQSTYLRLGLESLLNSDSSRSIAQLAKIKVMKPGGHWEDLNIDPCIKSIICVNLPSFSGGFNPWGMPRRNSEHFKPLFVDDGLIEVVGFRDALHGLVLLSSKGHGIRLAQAQRIEFEFQKGAADCTYMRIDGEPWKQPLPPSSTVKVEICHHGQVSILAATDCKSKSRNDDPSVSTDCSESPPSSSEENFDREEERRKFGSAETFRFPDDLDFSHLS